ncbi:MAG: UDP-N-acetyl glucosamine 2-epimerase, partial [Hyphomicrobiaceae bacterium]|nr:UDP-N-acetyl glucosamine 2-epimerase [Hyphomicrobiaceae bacterium]
RNTLATYGIEPENMKLIDPVGYFDIHRLLAGANNVFTDSGGLQKEAYFHNVPCITMRTETEWVETVEAGWNRLWSEDDFVQPRQKIDEYGDGDAADKIVALIKGHIG